jgi:hypothetical protein
LLDLSDMQRHSVMLTVLLILTIIAITIPLTSPEALQKEEEGYVSLKTWNIRFRA